MARKVGAVVWPRLDPVQLSLRDKYIVEWRHRSPVDRSRVRECRIAMARWFRAIYLGRSYE